MISMFAFNGSIYIKSFYHGSHMYFTQDYSFLTFWEIFFKYFLPFIATIWFWLKFQATPGKMVTRLRLVDALTGNTISSGQAIGRYFATILSLIPFGLGFIWIVFDRRNQSWHDKLAGTVVIRNRYIEKVIFQRPKQKDKQE